MNLFLTIIKLYAAEKRTYWEQSLDIPQTNKPNLSYICSSIMLEIFEPELNISRIILK
jgi:hypothetical protein